MRPKPFSEITDFEPAEIEGPDQKYIKGLFTKLRVNEETLPEGL